MQLDIEQIKNFLPHRYPFLLIDKILDLDIEEGTAIAQKNVTSNESFFNGHFPSQPIMPGVLILESMAQAIGILGLKTINYQEEKQLNQKKIFVLAGIDSARIKKPVVPGDILKLHVTMGKIKCNTCKSQAKAYVDGNLVASAKFLAAYRKLKRD